MSMTEKEARTRVKELKGFYGHLTTFVLVNAMLFGINVLSSPDSWWFLYPLMGWGIGIVSHAVGVFGIGNKKWEERKMQELMGGTGDRLTVEQMERLLETSTNDDKEEQIANLNQRIEQLEAIATRTEKPQLDYDASDWEDWKTDPHTPRTKRRTQ